MKNANEHETALILNTIATSMKKASMEQSSEIARSLYEIAVENTRITNTTTLLGNVVETLSTALSSNQNTRNTFLGKVANDLRLKLDERVSVINKLISSGKQEEAKILLEKLDHAIDATDPMTTPEDKNKPNLAENCTPS